MATATVDQDGSPVELLYGATLRERTRKLRRPAVRTEQPRATDGAELRASADRDGRTRPAGPTTPAAGARTTDPAPRPSVLAVQRHHARRSPDG